MKTKIIYSVCACLTLFFLAAGCRNEGEEPQPAEGKVTLTLNVAAQSGDSGSRADVLPEKELIHTLRIIIFDAEGSVEHNMLLTYNSGVEEVNNRTFEVKPNERKTIYLLANAEDLSGLDLDTDENIGLDASEALKSSIDNYVLSESDVTDAAYLPMSSSYVYQMDSENRSFDAYVVYAAAKFTFSFENQMTDRSPIRLSSVIIYQSANQSYLMANGVGNGWISQLENGNVITDYNIPAGTTHAPYTYTLPSKQVINYGDTYELPVIYLPESKNINESTDEQSYSVSFAMGVGADGTDEALRPSELTDAQGESLNSLFRSTHVDVRVIVRSLEDIEIIHGVYAMINPWTELSPIEGTIVEEGN